MRPSWDEYFLRVAKLVSEMGTCARRQVGCVLVDRRKNILCTGHNGPPPKWPLCRGTADEGAVPCPGAVAASGTNLDLCYANHSEASALLRCPDTLLAHSCYVTVSPCINCVKLLLCTGVCRVIFLEEYPHPESRELWTRWPAICGQEGRLEARTWEQLISLPGGRVETRVLGSSGGRRDER